MFSICLYVGAICLCAITKQRRNVKGNRCAIALMQPDVVRINCGRRRDAVC